MEKLNSQCQPVPTGSAKWRDEPKIRKKKHELRDYEGTMLVHKSFFDLTCLGLDFHLQVEDQSGPSPPKKIKINKI